MTPSMPNEDIVLFNRIKRSLSGLPDTVTFTDGKIISCHMLSRAVSIVFKIRCHDGFFCSRYRHSWVTTPNNNIIDLCPVATVGGPIMYSNDPTSPAITLYTPVSTLCSSVKNESFEKAVKAIISSLEQNLEGGSQPCFTMSLK